MLLPLFVVFLDLLWLISVLRRDQILSYNWNSENLNLFYFLWAFSSPVYYPYFQKKNSKKSNILQEIVKSGPIIQNTVRLLDDLSSFAFFFLVEKFSRSNNTCRLVIKHPQFNVAAIVYFHLEVFYTWKGLGVLTSF